MHKFASLPTPAELGLNLEEDSPDFSEQEAGAALRTESEEDFAQKAASFLVEGAPKAQPKYTLRRKSGILYCRVSMGETSRLFQMNWLRGTP